MIQEMEYSKDKGGQSPGWIICTEVGGRSFLHAIARHATEPRDVVIWCKNLDKAMRIKTLGELAQYFAAIPSEWDAYEEDPRFIDRHSL
jgi:hypothetical protein